MSNFLTRSFLISFVLEHGDTYIDVIQPVFDVLKACHFDSSLGIGSIKMVIGAIVKAVGAERTGVRISYQPVV